MSEVTDQMTNEDKEFMEQFMPPQEEHISDGENEKVEAAPEVEDNGSSFQDNEVTDEEREPGHIDIEYVPSQLVPVAMKYRRSNDSILAEVHEVVQVEGRRALKMYTSNNIPVYIGDNVAGLTRPMLSSMVGQRYLITFLTLAESDEKDEDGNTKYMAVGSIQEAEFFAAGELYSLYNANPEVFRERTFEGTVVAVLSGATSVVGEGNSQRVQTQNAVFINYNGLVFRMNARDFDYISRTKDFSDYVKIGDKVKFKVRRIERRTVLKEGEEVTDPSTQDVYRGRGTGDYYRIVATCLPFRKNPADKVRELEKADAFIAQLVNVESVKGLFVEIQPGWVIKGRLSPAIEGRYNVTPMDGVQNTRVTVRITEIDYGKRVGYCDILNFPDGTAASQMKTF